MGDKQPTVQAVDRDRDDAVVYLEGHDVDANVDLKALRRKIDCRLLPYMFCCYILQFLDKVMLNVSVNGVCCPTAIPGHPDHRALHCIINSPSIFSMRL